MYDVRSGLPLDDSQLLTSISIDVRYETFSNVVLSMQMICGMRRTVRTDIQTKLKIEHASVRLSHARPISLIEA